MGRPGQEDGPASGARVWNTASPARWGGAPAVDPLAPLDRAVARFCRPRQPSVPSAAERRAHAERAIDRYLAWCDGHVEALTRKSAREAAAFAATGAPAAEIPFGPVALK